MKKILILFLALSIFANPSYAEEASQAEGQNKPVEAQKPRALKDYKYAKITRKTLSQLYWRMGAFDYENDIDIDNFMLINRCDLYMKHYRDDFDWHKIRAKAPESLKRNIKSFPVRFQHMIPISLGRFDFETMTFPLVSPIKTSRFELVGKGEAWKCRGLAHDGRVHRYPHAAIAKMSAPLDLPAIEVTEEVAKKYNKIYGHLDVRSFRPAYLVLKFKVYEAIPFEEKSIISSDYAKLSAILEKIEVYADSEKNMHMSSIDFRNRNRSKFLGEGL